MNRKFSIHPFHIALTTIYLPLVISLAIVANCILLVPSQIEPILLQNLNSVITKLTVIGHNRQVFNLRLSNNNSVKRVAVMKR